MPVDGEPTGGYERLYTVGIFDLTGNRVTEIEDVQFFDFRQQFDVSADGRWIAILGYHRKLDQHGLFVYEIDWE